MPGRSSSWISGSAVLFSTLFLGPALATSAAAASEKPSDAPAYAASEDDLHRLADARARAQQGHLFVIFMDAAAAYHYGCYGYHRDTSPNIDAFARDGVIFERAIVAYPNTYHSFWSVTTSTWSRPAESGAMPGLFDRGPPPDCTNSFAALLRRHGRSVAISLNGFGNQPWRGFDVVRNLTPSNKEAQKIDWNKTFDRWRAPQFLPLVQSLFEREIQPGARGFFWLHYIEPHSPYTTPPPFNTRFTPNNPAAKFGPDAYDNNIAFVDHELGRLFEWMKKQGIYDKSTIILTSDHGEAWSEHGTLFHNTGVHDEEARVPLIVKFPKGVLLSKRRIAAPVSNVDLLPTVADLFGVECNKHRWSGLSFLPLVFTAQSKTHEYVFCRAGDDPEEEQWRKRLGLAARPTGKKPVKPNHFYSIRDERYLLTWQMADDTVKLYDMLLDRGEKHDLAVELPNVRQRMLAALKEWRVQVPQFIQDYVDRNPKSGNAPVQGPFWPLL